MVLDWFWNGSFNGCLVPSKSIARVASCISPSAAVLVLFVISIYSFGAERASLSYTDLARSAPPCLGELRLELSYRLSTPTLDFSGDAALVDTDASHGLFI